MNLNAIQVITRAGAVIISTLATFVVTPPILSPEEISNISWKNIFIFIAGVVGILIFDRLKQNSNLKTIASWIAASFIIMLVSYQYCYRRFSCRCYDLRVVISESTLQKEVQRNATSWDGPDRMNHILEAYHCNAGSLWPDNAILQQYYVMIAIYLMAVLLLTVLLIALSEVIKSQSHAA